MYRDAVAAEAAEATTPAKETKKRKRLAEMSTRTPGSTPLWSALHLMMACQRVPLARNTRLLHLL